MWLVLFLLLSFALGVQGQPCTPLRILPAPWPEDFPHPENAGSERIYLLNYTGGKYFVHWVVLAEKTKNYHFVSSDLHRWQPIEAELLTRPYYWRGYYYSSFLWGQLARSRDGVVWEALPAWAFRNFTNLTTNGKLLIAFGGFGDLWTSEDGADTRHRSTVPYLTRPSFSAQAKARRLIFTAAQYVGYTEDFETWHQQEAKFGGPDLIGVLRGWVIGFRSRTQDGETWLDIAKAPEDPAYPFINEPVEMYIAGQELVGLTSDARRENGQLTDPPTTGLLFYRNPTLEAWERGRILVELVGVAQKKYYEFDTTRYGWDGKQFFVPLTWHGWDRPHLADKVGIAVFSCADVGDSQMLVGVIRGEGAAGSFWQSSLFLHYPGEQQAEVLLQWLPFGQKNANPQEVRLWLNAGETREYQDVLAELFPEAAGAGSLRLISVGPTVVAAARTYSRDMAGTFGQEITPWRWQEGIGQGEEGYIPGLADSGSLQEGFRTNLGVQNLWVEPVEVEVVFRDQNGEELARLRRVLRAFEGYQWFRPLAQHAPAENVSAVVRIVGESQSRIAAYASRVDNRTGDGTTLRACRLPAQGTVP